MIPELFEVVHKRRDTEDTYTLKARPSNGSRFRFAPGQFNMLYVFGNGEIPISISGDEKDLDAVVHTVQAVGAVSRALTEMEPGQKFGLRGPFGRGWPVEKARSADLILMAGGLGLAPLRPVLYHVAANRQNFGRVLLLCGARSVGRLLFQEEFEQWKSQDIEVQVTLDLAGPEWTGQVGVVTTLVAAAATRVDLSNTLAMVCGPHLMMRFSVKELLRCGLVPERIHVSTERNMECGVAMCGHCQFGPYFLCRDGPVFSYDQLLPYLKVREL